MDVHKVWESLNSGVLVATAEAVPPFCVAKLETQIPGGGNGGGGGGGGGDGGGKGGGGEGAGEGACGGGGCAGHPHLSSVHSFPTFQRVSVMFSLVCMYGSSVRRTHE